MPLCPLGTIQSLSSFYRQQQKRKYLPFFFAMHSFHARQCRNASIQVQHALMTQFGVWINHFCRPRSTLYSNIAIVIWLIFWACKFIIHSTGNIHMHNARCAHTQNDSCRRISRKWYVKLIESEYYACILHMLYWQWRRSVCMLYAVSVFVTSVDTEINMRGGGHLFAYSIVNMHVCACSCACINWMEMCVCAAA